MTWSSQIHDLSPIKHAWNEFQNAIQDTKMKNEENNLNVSCQALVIIPQSKTDKIVQSVP